MTAVIISALRLGGAHFVRREGMLFWCESCDFAMLVWLICGEFEILSWQGLGALRIRKFLEISHGESVKQQVYDTVDTMFQ